MVFRCYLEDKNLKTCVGKHSKTGFFGGLECIMSYLHHNRKSRLNGTSTQVSSCYCKVTCVTIMFCSEFHWNGKKNAISYLFIIKINYVWFLTGKDRISMILHLFNYFFHVQCFCDCFLVKYPVSKKCINPTPLPHWHTNTKISNFFNIFCSS